MILYREYSNCNYLIIEKGLSNSILLYWYFFLYFQTATTMFFFFAGFSNVFCGQDLSVTRVFASFISLHSRSFLNTNEGLPYLPSLLRFVSPMSTFWLSKGGQFIFLCLWFHEIKVFYWTKLIFFSFHNDDLVYKAPED